MRVALTVLALVALATAAWVITWTDERRDPITSGGSAHQDSRAEGGAGSGADVETSRFQEGVDERRPSLDRRVRKIAVSFRIVEEGHLAGKARGALIIGGRHRIEVRNGKGLEPITLPVGNHEIEVGLRGCAYADNWSFQLLPSDGAEKVVDVPRPAPGVTVGGIAVDGAGEPLPEGTPMLVQVFGRFDLDVSQGGEFRWDQFLSGPGGHFHFGLEGSVVNARCGAWRAANRHHGEAWATFPTPHRRATLSAGTHWDLGRVPAGDPPVLLEANVSVAPGTSIDTELQSVQWWVRSPGSDPPIGNVPRGVLRPWKPGDWVSITTGWDGTGDAPCRLFGTWTTTKEIAVDATADGGDLAWRGTLAAGSRGVRIVLARSASVRGEVELPHPTMTGDAEIRLLDGDGVACARAVLRTRKPGARRSAFRFRSVLAGVYDLEVRAPLMKPFKKKNVAITFPNEEFATVTLGVIKVPGDWARAAVLVQDMRGKPLGQATAQVTIGTRTPASCAADHKGLLDLAWPTDAGDPSIQVTAPHHVPRRFSGAGLPSIVRLGRGTTVFLDPGFDPSELGWPGPLRIFVAATTTNGTTRVAVTSALDVVLGPLAPGPCGLALDVEARRDDGSRISRRFPLSPVQLSDDRDLEVSVPPDTVAAIRDVLK